MQIASEIASADTASMTPSHQTHRYELRNVAERKKEPKKFCDYIFHFITANACSAAVKKKNANRCYPIDEAPQVDKVKVVVDVVQVDRLIPCAIPRQQDLCVLCRVAVPLLVISKAKDPEENRKAQHVCNDGYCSKAHRCTVIDFFDAHIFSFYEFNP